MNRARGGRAVGCHSARFLLPFFGATGRDLSSTGRDPSSHRTEHVGALLASSEAFALFMSQGLGARRWLFPSARRRLFPSVRISVCAVALCASCEPASRAKPSMRCEARLLNVFYHEASGDKKLRRTVRAAFPGISMSVCVSGVFVSGKWLVGPCRTSNRATSFFI